MARDAAEQDAKPVALPPARSGPKSLILIAALVLIFLGVLWYASFVALNSRGPERAFFTRDIGTNDSASLYVSDLDSNGVVPISSLTVNITALDGTHIFSGPIGSTQDNGNYTVTVTWVDNDNSTTLTLRDDLVIRFDPPESIDSLILTTLYLYSDGREWGQFRFE